MILMKLWYSLRRPASKQGLTLVHFSAQLTRILSDRGAFRDCLGGV